MAHAIHVPLTLDQFLALPEAKPALEYTPPSPHGDCQATVSQKMSPTTRHSAAARAITRLLDPWAHARGWDTWPELRVILAGTARVPDVSVYPDDVAYDASGNPPAEPMRVAPEIAIEVVSPDEAVAEQEGKCREYIAHGAGLALLIDPQGPPAVTVFNPGGQYTYRDTEPIVALADLGLELTPAEVFAAMRRPAR